MKQQPKKKLLVNFLLLVVVIGVIIYVIKNSLTAILLQVARTAPLTLLGVCLLGVSYLAIEAINYRTMLAYFVPKLSWPAAFFSYCYAAFYRVITFGTGTLVAELAYLHQQNVSVSKSMGITSMHMVMYKLAILVYSSLGLFLQFKHLSQFSPKMIPLVMIGIGMTALLVTFLFIVTSSQTIHGLLDKFVRKILTKEKWQEKLAKLNQQVLTLRETVLRITEDRLGLLKLLALNLIKLVPWYSIPYLVLRSQSDISYGQSFALTAMVAILAGVIPSPAGIGSFEFVYLLLFSPIVGKVAAASSLLLYRFATYVLPFFIGLGYTAVKKQHAIKKDINRIKQAKK